MEWNDQSDVCFLIADVNILCSLHANIVFNIRVLYEYIVL